MFFWNSASNAATATWCVQARAWARGKDVATTGWRSAAWWMRPAGCSHSQPMARSWARTIRYRSCRGWPSYLLEENTFCKIRMWIRRKWKQTWLFTFFMCFYFCLNNNCALSPSEQTVHPSGNVCVAAKCSAPNNYWETVSMWEKGEVSGPFRRASCSCWEENMFLFLY